MYFWKKFIYIKFIPKKKFQPINFENSLYIKVQSTRDGIVNYQL